MVTIEMQRFYATINPSKATHPFIGHVLDLYDRPKESPTF